MNMKKVIGAALSLAMCASPFGALAENVNEAMPQITPPPLRTSIVEEILPENAAQSPYDDEINMQIKKYREYEEVAECEAYEPILFEDSSVYTELEGITTFRGNNYRDSASYGVIPTDPTKLDVEYKFKIGGLDGWGGVGWTGQASAVRWPEQVRNVMNIYDEKKAKDDLVEVIYASLDGKIRFYDLEDGKPTRDPISIGAPIKGSLTIDPRGYPLLYCGQGIEEVNGKRKEIGMRVFSLITGEVLLFINGHDKVNTRYWYSSDCSPLVDAESDTLLWAGENGLFYRVKLNTDYDPAAKTISIDPQIDRYWYDSDVTTRPGMENSFSAYNHYVFLPDNSGLLQCLDINTMEPVWAIDVIDDTDASPALEVDDDGQLWIYTATEIDLAKKKEMCYIRRVNGFTGEVDWTIEMGCSDRDDGGAYATPAIGKGNVSDLAFFTMAKTHEGSFLMAIEKETGEVRWQYDIGGYAWSSPTLCYDENDNAYLIQCNVSGTMRLFNAATGEMIEKISLDANVEGSPIVFDDMIVIGTRGKTIYGIRIK